MATGLSIIRTAAAIGVVCYVIIIAAIYLLPHFPLATKKTFPADLRMQMTLDQYLEFENEHKAMLLVLGSSVVERGINEITLDSLLQANSLVMRSSNSAGSGMFARTNILNLKTLLASGVKPAMVVYGFFIHDLNGASVIHDTTTENESSRNGLKERSILNIIKDGPRALSNLVDYVAFHNYLYITNRAYREIDNLSSFQKFAMGNIQVETGSDFRLEPKYLDDIKELYSICREHNIPFALFNAPLRPQITSANDLPYDHRIEAYAAMDSFAKGANVPIWNFDVRGLFADSDFEDIYHLKPRGARKMARLLGERVVRWKRGVVEQDVVDSSWVR
jgi:hypothetical protein